MAIWNYHQSQVCRKTVETESTAESCKHGILEKTDIRNGEQEGRTTDRKDKIGGEFSEYE